MFKCPVFKSTNHTLTLTNGFIAEAAFFYQIATAPERNVDKFQKTPRALYQHCNISSIQQRFNIYVTLSVITYYNIQTRISKNNAPSKK